MRILRLAYAIQISYAVLLSYLTTASVLNMDYELFLPWGTLLTIHDLIPLTWPGLIGAILINIYRSYSKKRAKPSQTES